MLDNAGKYSFETKKIGDKNDIIKFIFNKPAKGYPLPPYNYITYVPAE